MHTFKYVYIKLHQLVIIHHFICCSFHYIEFMKNFAKKRTHHIVNRISAGYLGRVIEVTDGDVGHGTEVSAGGQGHSTERGGFITKTG